MKTSESSAIERRECEVYLCVGAQCAPLRNSVQQSFDTVRRGRTPGHLLLPFGQFTLSHPTVIFNRFRCCLSYGYRWIWTRNAHPTMSYATAGKRCRFDPKKLFQKNLKKGLTKRGFCYILNKSSAMSHQKRQQLNKMESWLSGRRRTIGNRVGVMSVSRVQIPNSPP